MNITTPNIKNFHLPSKDSTELLSTLEYNNYGEILNSNAICLSKSNCLALGTDKSLLLLNFNFEWPSNLNHSSAIKFFQTIRTKTNTTQQNVANADSWIQDLHQCKSEAFYLNVIRSVPKSRQFFDLCKQFFSLDEVTLKNKRKSFSKQIREEVISSKKSSSSLFKRRKSEANENDEISYDSIEDLLDPNDEQLYMHKTLCSQLKLFDSYFHDFLSSLHPAIAGQLNQNQENQQQNAFDGYKYCQWNANHKLNLLFTITSCNQMVLFDLTRFMRNTNNNADLKDLNDESFENEDLSTLIDSNTEPLPNRQHIREATKLYDLKSNSKFINLTEYWLKKYRANCMQSKSLNQFLENLNGAIPVCAFWSKTVFELTNCESEFEFLFVVLKSNEIAVFIVYLDEENDEDNPELNVELYDCFRFEELVDDDEESNDEFVSTNLDAPPSSIITSITFFDTKVTERLTLCESGYGILAIGLSTGKIYFKQVYLELNRIEQLLKSTTSESPNQLAEYAQKDQTLKWLRLRHAHEFGFVEKIDLIKLKKLDNKFLVVIQSENRIKFFLFHFVNSRDFTQVVDAFQTYHVTEDTFNNLPQIECKNHLAKNYFKLIDFKLVNEGIKDEICSLDFLLTFENSYIQHLKLDIDLNQFTFVNGSPIVDLINLTNDIKFDLSTNQPQNTNYVLKTTKQIILSKSQNLLYQVFDFSKSHLVYKKPPQLQINVYKIKDTVSSDFLRALFADSVLDLTRVNDLIWLFKRELYLNNEAFFNLNTFNYLYECILTRRSENATFLNEQSLEKCDIILAHTKKLRLLVYFLSNFFQTTSLFDKTNLEIRDTAELKEEDEEISEEENESGDEAENNSDTDNSQSITQSKSTSTLVNDTTASQIDNTSIIIKSYSYYKTIFKELTLTILKHDVIDLIFRAYKLGFERLSVDEKFLLIVQVYFAIIKNFFEGFNVSSMNQKYSLDLKDVSAIETWLRDEVTSKVSVKSEAVESSELVTSSNSVSLTDLFENLACDMCGKRFRMDLSLSVENIRCESNHCMSRCQKTLLPLNSFRYQKCSVCQSQWNCLKKSDYPNFKSLAKNFNVCSFCI